MKKEADRRAALTQEERDIEDAEVKAAAEAKAAAAKVASEKFERDLVCSKIRSKIKVEDHVREVGRMLSITHMGSLASCSHNWLVQYIANEHGSQRCTIQTNGNSGTVEIVDVDFY